MRASKFNYKVLLNVQDIECSSIGIVLHLVHMDDSAVSPSSPVNLNVIAIICGSHMQVENEHYYIPCKWANSISYISRMLY